jgi:hypothetical protein
MGSPKARLSSGQNPYPHGGAITVNTLYFVPELGRACAELFRVLRPGGLLVHPARNLHYVDGSLFWPGVIPMALVGLGRAFQIDFSQYLSDYVVQLYNKMQTASIVDVLSHYPGLTWKKLAKPQYPIPESLPSFATLANQLIMGTGSTPTIPLFIGQGANGAWWEGTPGDKPASAPATA